MRIHIIDLNFSAVLIYGAGGFGKTTLANELCSRIAYRRHMDFVDVNLKYETFFYVDRGYVEEDLDLF